MPADVDLSQNPPVRSFAEFAFTNKHVLDFLSPTKCKEYKIDPTAAQSVSKSILEDLKRNNYYPHYSTTKNSRNFHTSTEPFKFILRVAYSSFVFLIISPVGALWHCALTGRYYAVHLIATAKNNPQEAQEHWRKIQNVWEAARTDLVAFSWGGFVMFKALSSFAFGIFSIGMIFDPRFADPTHSREEAIFLGCICAPMGLLISYFFLTALDSSNLRDFVLIESLPTHLKSRIFLALALRKEFGFVDLNGGLLPFSEKDKVDGTWTKDTIDLHGEAWDLLTELTISAERELFEKVRKAQFFLNKDKKEELCFSNPFKGNKVAEHLKKQYAITPPEKITRLMKELQSLQSRVEKIHDIRSSTLKFSPHLPKNINLRSCCIPEDRYSADFKQPYNVLNSSDLAKHINTIELPLCNPESDLDVQNLSLYEKFKQKVSIQKWRLEEGEPLDSLPSFLGMQDNYSHEEYKTQLKKYRLAIHPDKNNNSHESEELFKCLRLIQTAM